MVSVISLLLTLSSHFFLTLASALIIYIIYKYFRGIEIPLFWMYLAGGFYLLTMYGFFTASLADLPLYTDFANFTKLVANILLFMGIWALLNRVKKS